MGLGVVFRHQADLINFIRKLAPSLSDDFVNKIAQEKIVEGPNDRHIPFVKSLNNLDDNTIERRLQAYGLFPYIGDSDQRFEKDRSAYDALLESIDKGLPLFDAIFTHAKALGFNNLTLPHIKRMAKLDIQYYQDLPLLNEAAAYMDLNAFPVSREQYSVLSRFNSGLSAAYGVRAYNHGAPYPKKEKEFADMMEKLLSRFGASDYRRIAKAEEETEFYNIRDTISTIESSAVNSIIWSRHNEGYEVPNIMMDILSCMKPGEIAEANTAIHKNWAKISRLMEDYDQKAEEGVIQEWPVKYPYADSKTLPELENFKIVPLKTRTELKDEHTLLDGICIDTYGPNCIHGYSFCFSVRDEFDMSLSDFELDQYGNLVQHEAHGGKQPPTDQKLAVEVYVEAIRSGRLKENPDYPHWLEKVKDFSHSQINGYDEEDVDRAKYFIDTFCEIETVPKRLKTLLQAHKEWRHMAGQPNTPNPDLA